MIKKEKAIKTNDYPQQLSQLKELEKAYTILLENRQVKKELWK